MSRRVKAKISTATELVKNHEHDTVSVLGANKMPAIYYRRYDEDILRGLRPGQIVSVVWPYTDKYIMVRETVTVKTVCRHFFYDDRGRQYDAIDVWRGREPGYSNAWLRSEIVMQEDID